MKKRHSRCARRLLAVFLSLWLLPPISSAHDIPDQIRIQGFVKPEADTLHFVVRVPLVMLLNLNLPKEGPGYLALGHLDEALDRAAAATARQIVLYEGGERLTYSSVSTRISRLSERSFGSFEHAVSHIQGPPLPTEARVFWNQGYFDAHFQYPITSADADFSLDLLVAPGLRNTLSMSLRFLPQDGTPRAYELHYGSGPVHLDPGWHQAAWTFGKLGFAHILGGYDHLLFLLCLIAPFRIHHLWNLVAVITSFTIAHSITLGASVLGFVPQGAWFPPIVDLLIAVSIVYMAIENAVRVDLSRRWIVTGLFGLIHGFGFSFLLQETLQFAGGHLSLSLLSFNIGVEAGQLVFLLAVLPVLAWLLHSTGLQRYGVIIISVLAGHTAWHWMIERYEALRRTPWPEPGELTVPVLVAGVLLLTTAIAALWPIRHRLVHRQTAAAGESRPMQQVGGLSAGRSDLE
jgi:hypothetical protein